ncbi:MULTISPECIES: hypothetical protein [unclassified Pseudomonas]|uniref:hypothetical protein n=1 Tax=unclassified Pseudomonas TaxID=196821 RepID=UPI001944CE4E|nr:MULTISPECIES: hypothetical protein [unclassified Pseudomonas]MDC0689107.1 hypothetical protein [Mitsuaria sp. RG]MCE0914669.1 hypothetical protein [Pseudomonas sp. NMI760_13]MCP8633371.1 hypothetical protein [Pseudomonas sp. DVZ6]MDD7782876.1 hypothetical protein [Pseudomonas sp. DVZ24]BCJ06501.1 hypothetical protein PRtIB026_A37330 [Pseudomonas sp. RtIB026]
MTSNLRMQGLQDDLVRSAGELDQLCQALDGHARFLRHSIHQADAQAMDGHVDDLHHSACEMREIARSIRP